MKKEDWEKAKSRLRAPLGQVDLLCDGYSVTLVNECISMFRNGIAVYVNGEMHGSWFVQPLQTAYARAMDFAFRQVATGTLDLNTAIRRAVTPLAKRGLRTIEQKSGRSVGIEYACRRYIMDQLGQLDDEIQHADHDALGCDGWEISAHAACAPDHEPIQGRQYGDAEFEKLNNSLQRRIGHLNCGTRQTPSF